MSVPANVMQQMMKQSGQNPAAGGGTPQGPGSADARNMPPAAAPFSTPQEKRGLKATAMANVHIALTLLEQALPDLGAESPEGAAIVKALHGLAKLAGNHDNSDLVPAEVMQMVKSLPQMGGGTPVQQEIMRQQQEQAAQTKMKMQQAAQGAGQQQPGVQ